MLVKGAPGIAMLYILRNMYTFHTFLFDFGLVQVDLSITFSIVSLLILQWQVKQPLEYQWKY